MQAEGHTGGELFALFIVPLLKNASRLIQHCWKLFHCVCVCGADFRGSRIV